MMFFQKKINLKHIIPSGFTDIHSHVLPGIDDGAKTVDDSMNLIKKFIEVGKKIKKGDTIMIVEAMKTMNHVPSTSDGVVKQILVSDGQPVEFGQVLIVLE